MNLFNYTFKIPAIISILFFTQIGFGESFFLIDTETNTAVKLGNNSRGTLTNGTTINTNDLPKFFSIQYIPKNRIDKLPVKISLEHYNTPTRFKTLHISHENVRPYTLFGDSAGGLVYNGAKAAKYLTGGRYLISANNQSVYFTIQEKNSNKHSNKKNLTKLNKKNWKLTSTHNKKNLWLAKDNNIKTRWTTKENQTNGQAFQIELPKITYIDSIELITSVNGKDKLDYPRRYELLVSRNKRSWEIVASGKGGISGTTYINQINTYVKYIKIVQTGFDKKYWWSIYEINAYSSQPNGAPLFGPLFKPPHESTCKDNTKNGLETGIDCGGPNCGLCKNFLTCKIANDCQSRNCSNYICQPKTYTLGTQVLKFAPDNSTDFLNPERGWMDRSSADEFTKSRLGNDRYSTKYSVVWTQTGGTPWKNNYGNPFRLDNYRTIDLPPSLLKELETTFKKAREAGIKLKVRFAYNYSGDGRDTTKFWMLKHIKQLGPILSRNADTIAALDAGFIGKWGEMHSSTDLKNKDRDRVEVVNALLSATPKWMNIHVRYPEIAKDIFNDPGYKMDINNRFSGSDQSRIGWYNDCLWSNKGNTGTYNTWGDNFAKERDVFEKIGRYASTSGESCDVGGLNYYNSCKQIMFDMKKTGGPDTLLRGFWDKIYARMQREGCYNEVSRRIGYRLQLASIALPHQITRGKNFNISVKISNTGFGKVYNPRPIDLIFIAENGSTITKRITKDARKKLPLAGETVTANWSISAPLQLKSGQSYDVYLRLPDPSKRLERDNRYSIRLANDASIWDAKTGRHDLNAYIDVQ